MKTRRFLRILPVFSVLILLVQNSAVATGTLTVPDLNLGPGTNLLITLNGPVAGTQFDQIIATNSVTINDANLVLTVGFTPIAGTTFEIINNEGSAVSGTGFHGLPEASTFAVSGDLFQISYVGGTGNDVVLTARDRQMFPTRARPGPSCARASSRCSRCEVDTVSAVAELVVVAGE